jgi:hypothetical protein
MSATTIYFTSTAPEPFANSTASAAVVSAATTANPLRLRLLLLPGLKT